MTPRLRRLVTVALVATVAGLAAPAPPALAADQSNAGLGSFRSPASIPSLTGTLVYIADSNVWIARPDGSGARRLTSDGTAAYPYVSPSEDDAGHIVVGHLTRDRHSSVKDARLVRMDQSGNVLQSFDTPVRSLSIMFARVSPDGAKVAYGALFGASDCADYGDCYTFFDHTLHYSSATRPAVPSGAGQAAGVNWATWAGNNRTILELDTDNDIGYQAPSERQAHQWFHTCQSYDTGCDDTTVTHQQPSIDRAGDRYTASVHVLPWSAADNGQQYLLIAPVSQATTASPPSAPAGGCYFRGPDAVTAFPGPSQLTVGEPSFSPDGREVAFTWRANGTTSVAIAVAPDLGDCAGSGVAEVIPGGSQPFWSPAGLSAYHRVTAATRLAWRGGAVAVRGRHRVGKVLSVARHLARSFSPRATGVSYRWLRNGKPIRGAHHRTHRVTRRDRHKRLRVRVTGHRGGYLSAALTSRRVRIR